MPDKNAESDEKGRNNSHASLLMTTSSTHVRHVESHTSLNQSAHKIKDEHDQTYMTNSSLLSNDFVVMLDCSPTIEETFCEESPEFNIAWLWLNKLTTMHCNNLNDLRLRNAYMCHFIVCLNQRRLTGIFRERPPAELIWVNFSEHQAAQHSMNVDCSHDQSQAYRTAPSTTSSCVCTGHRTSECFDSYSNSARPSGGTTATSLPRSPVIQRRQLLRSVPITSDEEMHQIYRNNKANFHSNHSSTCAQLSTSRSQSSPAKFQSTRKVPNAFRSSNSQKSPQDARQRMVVLMELIKKELRGEPDLENKDILEAELRRYRDFFEQHMQDNSDFEAHKGGDSNSERTRLLLNMQTDLIRMLKEGRKSVDETSGSVNNSSQQQQHSIPGSASGSPQRVANKRSSITVNMPAAGLGQRPPSIISTTSQDEGGFNESTPEVKAKLQPSSYDLQTEEQPHSLNYVDVGYRLNPDGSESREVYGSEAELYDTAKVSDMQRKFHGANGFAQESSTVYAIIKPDVQDSQPVVVAASRGVHLQSPTSSSVEGSPLHRGAYNSPPVGVVSPIRRRNSNNQDQSVGGGGGAGGGSAKSTPPCSPARAALKGIAPIASIDAHEEEELDLEEEEEDEHLAVEYVEVLELEEEEEAPVLPERRAPAQNSLELQDLEYADTSAGEDEEDIINHLKGDFLDVELIDDVVDEVIKVHVNHSVAIAPPVPNAVPAAAIPREDSLPDDMTAAEAERLLSSR
ncbi:hypothetical protein M5D96_008026 [Drosophila gunungcola]|uniref:DUF4485 domain-containing protein n=1 Tax=Drosophila gunungcola TaxID=103775 RepID=A0A9P9YLR2_9MUSC|nr:hypothetical protein M5D96_008026 [Drosophila gunungcola]